MAHTKAVVVKPFTVSYSRLELFERCPAQYKERYILGVQEVRKVAADRGVAKHKSLEDYLTKPRIKMLPEYKGTAFEKPLIQLRKDKAEPEQKWAFTRGWVPTKWKGPKTWLRAVTDAYTLVKGVLRVIDFKSGKVYDKHSDQGQLYAACGVKYAQHVLEVEPKAVRVEFWYLDKGFIGNERTFTLKELERVQKGFTNRIAMLEMAKAFPEVPGYYCSWCDRSSRRGGKCKKG